MLALAPVRFEACQPSQAPPPLVPGSRAKCVGASSRPAIAPANRIHSIRAAAAHVGRNTGHRLIPAAETGRGASKKGPPGRSGLMSLPHNRPLLNDYTVDSDSGANGDAKVH